jgi:hypothetical protein
MRDATGDRAGLEQRPALPGVVGLAAELLALNVGLAAQLLALNVAVGQRALVIAMECGCNVIDYLPDWTWRVPYLHRLGCGHGGGLAIWSGRLDERWGTRAWGG